MSPENNDKKIAITKTGTVFKTACHENNHPLITCRIKSMKTWSFCWKNNVIKVIAIEVNKYIGKIIQVLVRIASPVAPRAGSPINTIPAYI